MNELPMRSPDDPPSASRAAAIPAEAFGRLLLLYLCPGPFFRDTTRGTLFEQAAALRFNQARRSFLLIFARRWATLALFAFGCGALFEEMALAVALPAAFFTAASCLMAGILWLLAGYAVLGRARLRVPPARKR